MKLAPGDNFDDTIYQIILINAALHTRARKNIFIMLILIWVYQKNAHKKYAMNGIPKALQILLS